MHPRAPQNQAQDIDAADSPASLDGLHPAALQAVAGALRPSTADASEFLSDEEAWKRLDAKLASQRRIPGNYLGSFSSGTHQWGMFSPGTLRRWVGLGVVASLAVLAILYTPDIIVSPLPSSASRVYATQTSQRATVTLDDGTTAILAPKTKLTVSGRSVTLIGQALFTVASNRTNPFIITVGSTSVRVLGTTFSVRQYPEERFAQIAVAEGKVAVNDAVVTTGEIATVSANSTPKVTRNKDISMLLAWAQGRLAFQDVPASEVFAELNRWYGTDIRASEDILRENITVELATESQSQAVEFIATFLNARVERKGNVVFLRGNQ